jgi:hypothetical protein
MFSPHQVRFMDWWIHPGFPRILPADVDQSAGVRWGWQEPSGQEMSIVWWRCLQLSCVWLWLTGRLIYYKIFYMLQPLYLLMGLIRYLGSFIRSDTIVDVGVKKLCFYRNIKTTPRCWIVYSGETPFTILGKSYNVASLVSYNQN